MARSRFNLPKRIKVIFDSLIKNGRDMLTIETYNKLLESIGDTQTENIMLYLGYLVTERLPILDSVLFIVSSSLDNIDTLNMLSDKGLLVFRSLSRTLSDVELDQLNNHNLSELVEDSIATISQSVPLSLVRLLISLND